MLPAVPLLACRLGVISRTSLLPEILTPAAWAVSGFCAVIAGGFGMELHPGGVIAGDQVAWLFVSVISLVAGIFPDRRAGITVPWCVALLASLAQTPASLALSTGVALLSSRTENALDRSCSFILAVACVTSSFLMSGLCLASVIFLAGRGKSSEGRTLLSCVLVMMVAVRVFCFHTVISGDFLSGLCLAGVATVLSIMLCLLSLRATGIKQSLAALAASGTELLLVGIALAEVARAGDMPLTARAAFSAVFTGLTAGLPLVALAVSAGAVASWLYGSDRLTRLGAVQKVMPRLSLLLGLGLFSLSCLPPGGMFTALWLEAQVLLLLPADGSLLTILPWRILLAAQGLALGLAALAACRVGIALFGGSAPDQQQGETVVSSPPGVIMVPFVVVTVLCLLLSFFPGLVLRWQSALLARMAGGESTPAHWLFLQSPDGLSIWSPAAVGGVLLCAAALVLGIRRGLKRYQSTDEVTNRPTDVWNGGYAAESNVSMRMPTGIALLLLESVVSEDFQVTYKTIRNRMWNNLCSLYFSSFHKVLSYILNGQNILPVIFAALALCLIITALWGGN